MISFSNVATSIGRAAAHELGSACFLMSRMRRNGVGCNPRSITEGTASPTKIGQVCYFIVSILNIGYFDTIFSNAEMGASLLTGICGRAPGASCKYAFKIGALWLTSISSSRTCSVIPCRSCAFPPAALTLRTQFASSPNMDTRYLSPFITVIASGKLIVFPDFLPTTSKVTR